MIHPRETGKYRYYELSQFQFYLGKKYIQASGAINVTKFIIFYFHWNCFEKGFHQKITFLAWVLQIKFSLLLTK